MNAMNTLRALNVNTSQVGNEWTLRRNMGTNWGHGIVYHGAGICSIVGASGC